MKKTILLICMFLSCTVLFGQRYDRAPRFGVTEDWELDMTVYPADTTAGAVLLYTETFVLIGIDGRGAITKTTTYRDRWKILKESGKDMVDYEILYYRGDENVSAIKATTVNRAADGKVEKTAMSKKFIYQSKYSDAVNRVTFAPENIRVGSVVDVSYELHSSSPEIGLLEIQQECPVNQGIVTVCYPEYFSYNHAQSGIGSLEYKQVRTPRKLLLGDSLLDYNEYQESYAFSGVPSTHTESFNYCPSFYDLAVDYVMSVFSVPGVVYRSYNEGWDVVDKHVRESQLPRRYQASFPDKQALADAVKGLEAPVDIICAVRQLVASRVKWDKKRRLIPDVPSSVWKAGTGNSADINALVASGLNALEGFDACPVLLKLRSSGPMVTFHVSDSEFDMSIIRIIAPDGSKWYLDASSANAYPNVLPPNELALEARLIPLDVNAPGYWVNLQEEMPTSLQIVSVTYTVEDDQLVGAVSIKGTNHESYDMRLDYHSYDSENAWIEETENRMNVEMDSMEFKDKDAYDKASLVNYTFRKELEQVGDLIYIYPFFKTFHPESAFQEEQRQIPVDLPYKSRMKFSCVLMIPDGYALESLPESRSISSPSLGGSAIQLTCRQIGNRVQLSYNVNWGTMLISPNEYADLRTFWEQAVLAEKSVIVLKRVQ